MTDWTQEAIERRLRDRIGDAGHLLPPDGAVGKRAMNYCSNCGAPLPEGGKFCSSCGTAASSARNEAVPVNRVAQPPVTTNVVARGTNSWKAVSGFISLCICLWVLYQLGVFGDLQSAVTTPTQQNMYQRFTVGYWNYRIDDVKRGRTLGKGSFAQKADGQFVTVFLTVQNNDTTPSTLPQPVLKDGMGREHSSKMVFGSDLPGEDLTIATLNPGVSKSGYFIFDVPNDVYDLRLLLSGGHNSGEKAVVPIS
jgi:hypothetical protein